MLSEAPIAGASAIAVMILIAMTWWWLGRPVPMPAIGAPDRIQCVSYAPFRGAQSPLHGGTHIPAAQIEDDLNRLKSITDCVRTYSMELGLDQVPAIARRLGMKVHQGLWLSNKPDRNRQEIDAVIALAKRYPDVIQSIVVGNEVLLRGELSPLDLGNAIREVKRQVPTPVTYADVWEFWQRNRELADLVDFVTIHILPYWEDFPIPAAGAAAHVESIRERMAGVFPGKEILIGETGWPSAGRMREGALPSRVNQALVLQEVLAIARSKGYRVNVIEAFDQPWKRELEGTVGGHWGLFDAADRLPKFEWGKPVSSHPLWRWQAAGGIGFAALIFAAAWLYRRGGSRPRWAAIATTALAGGAMIGWALELMVLESLGIGGWLRSVALVALALLTPIAAALARRDRSGSSRAEWILGFLAVAATVIAIQVALGLVFDPRYKDFPFAPLTASVIPIALVALFSRGGSGADAAERMGAGTLALSAVYILFNESIRNWQSVWLCALLLVLALSLVRFRWPRAAQSSE
jgi:glucan 1,3-beta-glucosidase